MLYYSYNMINIFKSDHPFIAVTYWSLRKIIGYPIRLFLIKKVINIQNIPVNGPAIIAFNHQSFFDFLCFAAVAPRNIHFLSAEKFFEHKLWRLLMIFTGQIKVKRGDHDKSGVHQSIARHVRKGTLIGIFPEGTRSPYNDEMLKAFTGIAQFSLKHHIPIIPVGLLGTHSVMSKKDSWPKIKKIVIINVGEPMYFPDYLDKHTDHSICTHVTEKVMFSISQLSGKKYKHYESKEYKQDCHN